MNNRANILPGDKHEYPERMNTRVAASYLGFSVETLRASRSTGLLCNQPAPPFRKIGRHALYDRSSLDNWLSNFPEMYPERANTAEHKLAGGA